MYQAWNYPNGSTGQKVGPFDEGSLNFPFNGIETTLLRGSIETMEETQ